MPITAQQFGDFDKAYDHINKALFANQLPDCFITINKQAHSAGYYRHGEFVKKDGNHTDEISLNYNLFLQRTTEYIISTLVHEMCHQWQAHCGKDKPRKSYHNAEFAQKMESIGLMPSSTGEKGGHKTGQKMSDYLIKGGQLDKQIKKIVSNGFTIRWTSFETAHQIKKTQQQLQSDEELIKLGVNTELLTAVANIKFVQEGEPTTSKPKTNSKTKFTCPECQQNAWAKPTAYINCGLCELTMEINE